MILIYNKVDSNINIVNLTSIPMVIGNSYYLKELKRLNTTKY